MVADPPYHCHGLVRCARLRSAGAMAPVDAILPAPFEHGMLGNDDAAVDDADQVRHLLDLDDPARPVGHAVVVAADRHEPVVADPPLELQDGIEAVLGKALQFLLLFGEGFGHHALRRSVHPHIGDGVEPGESWALRSSILRKDRPRKKSSRI
jgi:hypothetical protein